MKSFILPDSIIEEAREAGGMLELDFSKEAHYTFFLEHLGGAEHLKNTAPLLLNSLNSQKKGLLRAEPQNELNLTDDYMVHKLQVTPNLKSDGNSLSFLLSAETELSLCTNTLIPRVSVSQYFRDAQTKDILKQIDQTLSGETNSFISPISCDSLAAGLDERLIRIDSVYSMTDQSCNGTPFLRGKVCSSTAIIQSFQNDVSKVELVDPVIKHPDREYHPDHVCISYHRKSQMSNPDYHKELELDPVIKDMPVHLPFTITVSLKNKAYFYKSPKTGYFYEKYQPRISLYRVLHDEKEMPGCARMIQPWSKISDKNVEILDYNRTSSDEKILEQPNKIKIIFPEDWNSDLNSQSVMDRSTEAELYGNLLLNICHQGQNTPKAGYVSVIAQYEYQSTDPAQAKAERLFFQWGCMAWDTLLLTPSGIIAAQDVHIGDLLLSPDGSFMPVKDITTGTEKTLFRIQTHSNTLNVSATHTLCLAGDDGSFCPTPACDARCGQRIYAWDPEKNEPVPEEIIKITTIPYEDTVYNFQFDKETYLIGNGLLIGDQTMQGHYPPGGDVLKMNALSPKAADMQELLMNLCSSLPRERNNTPVFKHSDKPESYAMHYFCVKYLLFYNSFPLEQAQTIAEYCQFMADNATTGSLLLDGIPDWVNEKSFYRLADSQFEVPIIPTAMAKWYDTGELDTPKPWYPTDSDECCFHVCDDLLRPFHFFPGEETPEASEEEAQELADRVIPCPPRLSGLLKEIAASVLPYKKDLTKLPEELMMKLGIYLHILIDTILHQNFGARRSWINMAYREGVFTPQGKNVENDYPPYQDIFDDDAAYDDTASYPAGLEKIGWTVNETFLKLSYQFPNDTSALGNQSLYDLWDNYAQPNSYTYACGLSLVNDFLRSCLDLPADPSWLTSPQFTCIEKNFRSTVKDFAPLSDLWQKEQQDMDFNYNAEDVFRKITGCDTTKETTEEKYRNFFCYTKILYDLQHLWEEE